MSARLSAQSFVLVDLLLRLGRWVTQVLLPCLQVFEEMATKREAEREELKKELAQWASLPLTEAQQAEGKQAGEPPRDAAEAAGQMTMVGSAAVRAARVAHREAAMMRRAAAEAREASSGLAKRVEELELELGELAGKAQSADQVLVGTTYVAFTFHIS